MTDKELIAAAARAAEIPHRENDAFDPLTNDGDAIRVMAKLGIMIAHVGSDAMQATAPGRVPMEERIVGANLLAAMRRAIVRAAAAIVKTP